MDWTVKFDKQVAEYLPDLKITAEEPMRNHTSFRIGGPAKRMAFPENGEQVVLLVSIAQECGVEPLVIGNGSNLLVSDQGLDRLVINMSSMNRMELLEGGRISADAGALLVRLADFACRHGLTGLEFAHGIPGTLGGAVCMNAGAYDGEMKQVIESVTVLFPQEGVRTLTNADMEFSYRHSLLSRCEDAVVLRASFRLEEGDSAAIREKMQQLMQRRKASQPLEWPSAGSTFKRPEGYFAGTLIDQCGLKGLSVGGAQVSEKHAGFIINQGKATCEDVVMLIRRVQERVFQEKGVQLEPEVKIIH